MAFFTKSEARAAAGRTRIVARGAGKTFEKILKEETIASAATASFDVFLSHSISDAELVTGVKALLEAKSLKVYVDWVEDPLLDRSKVSKATAALLRARLRQCKSLIYLATDNSTTSKWMPWEVGYFDGFKPGCVAVMPVLDQASEQFVGQEYLGLYPVVTKDTYANGTAETFVEESGVQWSTLSSFAKGLPEGKAYSRR
jgi:TIR domain